ncbi:response regulator [Spirosoma pollinicola]|uniref:DNA-binding response regulator n=1 Tax=Spirosoma pollinicola TaxID=2057025 RepID=A0A2K8Z7D4_9BACT|nr:response regulator [Spirosoma pollinicola]AUD05729.1 DNA-binding response regulator [Spirosoma pollinicola]
MSIKLLVIEDFAQIRENIAELLTINGYTVRTAADGVKGIVQAKVWQPNLIVCDIMMPDMDGHQVLESIRNYPGLVHVPFIFLTAKADIVDVRRGMVLGADDYLTKPFLGSDLLMAIESRLKRSQQQQGNPDLSTNYLKTIFGHDEKGSMVLQVEDCLYFFTRQRGYYVWHKLGLFQLNKSLEKLTGELNPRDFFRVNRHVVLHRKSIQKYAYWEKGKYCLFISVSEKTQEVILPKARFSAFKAWLSG